jgi:hypothetical protein
VIQFDPDDGEDATIDSSCGKDHDLERRGVSVEKEKREGKAYELNSLQARSGRIGADKVDSEGGDAAVRHG